MPSNISGNNPYLSGIWTGSFNYNDNPPSRNGSWDPNVSAKLIQTRLKQVRAWRTKHLSRPHNLNNDGDAILETPGLDKLIIDLGVKIEQLEMRGAAIGQLDPNILRPSQQSRLNHIQGIINKLEVKKAQFESERNQRKLAFEVIAQRLNEAVTILESYPQ